MPTPLRPRKSKNQLKKPENSPCKKKVWWKSTWISLYYLQQSSLKLLQRHVLLSKVRKRKECGTDTHLETKSLMQESTIHLLQLKRGSSWSRRPLILIFGMAQISSPKKTWMMANYCWMSWNKMISCPSCYRTHISLFFPIHFNACHVLDRLECTWCSGPTYWRATRCKWTQDWQGLVTLWIEDGE